MYQAVGPANAGTPQVMMLGQVNPNAGPAIQQALGYLSNVQSMIIRQRVNWGEFYTGCEQRNRYRVMAKPPGFDIKGQDAVIQQLPPFFNMKERSDCCERTFLGPFHTFDIDVTDPQGIPIFTFKRQFECTLYCMCAILNPQHIEIVDGMGQFMGQVIETVDCGLNMCGGRRFHVLDAQKQLRFQLMAPSCQFGPNCICEEWIAEIHDPVSGVRIGDIKNCFPGCCTVAACTKSDNFEINCSDPSRFTPVDKVILLGATILIDFMMFERRKRDDAL